jgi:hypothetical protein
MPNTKLGITQHLNKISSGQEVHYKMEISPFFILGALDLFTLRDSEKAAFLSYKENIYNSRCQFYQRFLRTFFIRKSFLASFSSYVLALSKNS